MSTWDDRDVWGELIRTTHGRYVKVWVDYDELTAAQARNLASWLLKMAVELDADSAGWPARTT